MGWTEAHAKAVSMMEGITGLSTEGGVPGTFKHYDDATVQDAPDTRAFWFEILSGGMRGHVTIAPPRWFHYEVDLVVTYRFIDNPAALYKLIALDHAAIATVMPDQSLWDGASSTIESFYVEVGDQIVQFDIEIDVERGVVIVRHHMFWEFRP